MRPVDPHQLDVRALGEALVVLDQRPEPAYLVPGGLAADDGVWVADRDRRQLDRFAHDVQRLRRPDVDLSDVELDLAAAQACRDLPWPDADPDRLLPAPSREPAGSDARPVP